MTPGELKAARHSLGLSADGFARLVGAASGRTVRGWESGERNGKPAPVPVPVERLILTALAIPAAREYLVSLMNAADHQGQDENSADTHTPEV